MTTSPRRPKRELRGVPCPLALDAQSAIPIYQQVYDSYRTRILRRELRAGEPVPSTREMAHALGVSRQPVLIAYGQLLAEGYFESRIGAGTFVAASVPTATRPSGVPTGRRAVATRTAALPRYELASWGPSLGPFQVGQPAVQDFPREIWSRLVARQARRMDVRDLQYGDPLGLETLRDVIANYVRTARAVRCDPRQIMIVSGSQQALDISTRVLLDPGASAWVEEPGYWLVHHVLTSAGCRIVPVPVDQEGLRIDAGIARDRTARAAFVTPSHQYPLGVTLSATRRLELLRWAEEAGAWIIEDDYDSEYRYDRMPMTSLQGLDTHGRVIYIGTFSKLLFPSLRVGYLVIPPDLVERFAAVRQAADLCPSSASQSVLADFIRDGHFSRHIRKMRRLYDERRHVLVEAIRREFGDSAEVVGAEAGMHLTLLLDDRLPDQDIAAQAARRGLWLSALSLSYASTGNHARRGFVLGFGNAPTATIPGAVRLLGKLVRGR